MLRLLLGSVKHYNTKVPVVGVAQLVEHRVVVPVAAGSSPVAHPIFNCAALTRTSNPQGSEPCLFKHRHLVLNHVVHGVTNAADAITGGAPSGKGHPVHPECSVVIDHYS